MEEQIIKEKTFIRYSDSEIRDTILSALKDYPTISDGKKFSFIE